MQLSHNPCNLLEVFRRIEDITLLQAKNKSLNIRYDRGSVKHTLVNTDELRLEQILINIISNAIKYTPEGKDVELIVGEEEMPGTGKNRYRFIIRDTGVGISEEYLPHIFESFTREENTKLNRVQGTGLGLAITAKVVEMMGGTISVKSKVGEGSEFTVVLEMDELQERREEADRAPVEADLSGRRVLLVEDNEINAEIAVMILSQYGLLTERAKDGQEGFEKVRISGEGYYDAVLMDIQMPVMNGYEASSAIRAMEGSYFKHVPIIAMSANAYDEDVRDSLRSGMNAHIAKPYQPEDLMAMLGRYIKA
jgi:CheY-like chemotaxis protein